MNKFSVLEESRGFPMVTTVVNFDKQLLTPSTWKKTLLSEGYSPLTLAVSDPTGMSQKLTAYQKVANGSRIPKLKPLNEITLLASKLISSYQSNVKKKQLFIYLEALGKAAAGAYNEAFRNGLSEILEGVYLKYLNELRLFARSEFSEADLNFVLDVLALQKNFSKGGISYEDVVNEQDRIMDQYGIRNKMQTTSVNQVSEATDVNLPRDVKDNWVDAWKEQKDWPSVKKSLKCMEKAREVVYLDIYLNSYSRWISKLVN